MTADDLQRVLLDNYRTGQATISSASLYDDIRSAWPYYDANYRDLLADVDREAAILDVGTGPGTLLAWLREAGFRSVKGVDASPGDVNFAASHLGEGVVTLGDAREVLEARPGAYDVVMMKAVLEHVAKNDLLPLLDALSRSLRPRGRLVVEVPNMDWLLAAHERYMDLTHQGGFTPQSLESLLRLRFASVSVRGSRLAAPTRSQRLLRRPLVALIRHALYVLGEGGDASWFHNRSLIALARDPSAS